MAGNVADQLAYLVAKIGWHLDAEIEAAPGSASLSIEQCRILDLLHEQGGRAMSDLAQSALIEAPTLTKIIDRMVAEALVYRVPDARDRRRVLVYLSDRGRRRIEALRPAIAAQEQRLAKRLGKAGIQALQRLARALDQDVVGWTPSNDMNVIDSNEIEHDVAPNPVPAFRHHAPAEVEPGTRAPIAERSDDGADERPADPIAPCKVGVAVKVGVVDRDFG